MASEMWDIAADGWERNADIVDEFLAAATARMLDAAQISAGNAVLEVACGPGGAGIAAARRVGDSGRVVLADVAPAMVAAAARRTAAMENVSTLVGDQVDIDAPDGAFDAVIGRHGLMFADPAAAAVREAVRVLRSGGHYATITWGARADNPWLGLVFDAVGEQFGVVFPPPELPGPFSLDDPDLLVAALQEGGLRDVRVERIDTPMAVASLDEWWSLVPQLAGPLAVALAGMEPEVSGAIRERALGHAATAVRVTEAGVEFPGSVLVASGRSAV
jgi:SAM-dependent methyltransferase